MFVISALEDAEKIMSWVCHKLHSKTLSHKKMENKAKNILSVQSYSVIIGE